MNKLKLKFVDFWPDFDRYNNYFYRLLSHVYQIEFSDEPDILIYSVFGSEFKNYDCIRIFYTGESIRPNFEECDYAFSFDHSDDVRNYRLPLYALDIDMYMFGDMSALTENKDGVGKTKFCNFIYSNDRAEERKYFFQKLSQYKQVDSAGAVFNNLGYYISPDVPSKLEFIKPYKFTIAFENTSYPGYTTEKIVHPMLVHSLPIYWGNPVIDKDFNPKSFVNAHDYKDLDALVDKIIEIDKDDSLYSAYLRQPYFHDNKVNSSINPRNVLKKFEFILTYGKTRGSCLYGKNDTI